LSQISEEAGIPIRTVERTVSHLKQKQVLEREGSNRSGRWKVVKRVDLD
jgi:predicted HTH transcriptional regulator